MTTNQSGNEKEHKSSWRVFLITWITSVVAAVVVLCITRSFSEWDIVKSMELLGQDAATRSYAKDEHNAKHRVIVVLIDKETKRLWEHGGSTVGQRLPALVRLVRQWANAVALDLELGEGIADSAKDSLVAELKRQDVSARVVVPMRLRPSEGGGGWEHQPDWLDARGLGANASKLVRAAGLLTSDDYDGVVRHLTSGVCVSFPSEAVSSEDIRYLRVPSLAEAVVDPHEQTPCHPQTVEAESSVILFQDEKFATSTIRTISAKDLIDENGAPTVAPSKLFPMKDAFVLIGQTGPEAWTDQHRTPLGIMPGVLVTANSIFTLDNVTQKQNEHHKEQSLYHVGEILALGALYALIYTGTDKLVPREPARHSKITLASGAIYFTRFAAQIVALTIYFVLATILVGFFWTFMAASALADGVAFGTFVPVLAVGLESLMEAGEVLIKSARDALEWLLGKTKIGVLAIVFLVIMLSYALAEETAGTLTLRSETADVRILRGNQFVKPAGAVWNLQSSDIVNVGPGTDVWAEVKGHPGELLRGPTTLCIDSAPRTGISAILESFWSRSALRHYNDPGLSLVPGASPVPRGADEAAVADPFAIVAAGGDMVRANAGRGTFTAAVGLSRCGLFDDRSPRARARLVGRDAAIRHRGGEPGRRHDRRVQLRDDISVAARLANAASADAPAGCRRERPRSTHRN